MSDNKKRRVWVIGAGFSRSLGCPLLNDVLSSTMRTRIYATYGDFFPEEETEELFWLYHYGADFPNGPLDHNQSGLKGRKHWQNAEEFLELLDQSMNSLILRNELSILFGDAMRAKLRITDNSRIPKFNLTRLRQDARRAIAASCSAFLEETVPGGSRPYRWDPYVKWMQFLTNNDTIVSFNYDRVIELLVHPDVCLEHLPKAREANNRPVLCKLHGSVNWTPALTSSPDEPSGLAVHDWQRRLLAPDMPVLVIATPGGSKDKMRENLKSSWNFACERLKDAEEIYFLGYRMPESDSDVREQFLAALRLNQNKNLKVTVVLGDDEKNTKRLRVLLRTTLDGTVEEKVFNPTKRRPRNPIVIPTPLFVEDFLSVWAPENFTA